MKLSLADLKQQELLCYQSLKFHKSLHLAVCVLRYFSGCSLNHLLVSTQPELLKPLLVEGTPSHVSLIT